MPRRMAKPTIERTSAVPSESPPLSPVDSAGFRRLWIGDSISMLGDWFTYVAVGTLAVEGGEGALAVAVLLIGHSLPRAVLAPWAGRLADRLDRRSILVAVCLLRAVAVLGMVAAAAHDSLLALQVLVFVRMGLSAFIDPAATAILPQLVGRPLVGRANAILGATWSVVFAVGAALGGWTVALAGPVWALGLDALTFVVAALVFRSLPASPPPAPVDGEVAPSVASAGGWSLAWSDPDILAAALGKLPALLANGGAWVFLHEIAESGRFGATAVGLGVLHTARAIGAGIGPLLWFGRLRGTPLGIALGTAVSLAAVAVFALAQSQALILIAAALWGLGIGATWVTATSRMQTVSDDAILGRVASVDLIGHSIGICVGALVGALVVDWSGEGSASAWVGVVGGLIAWALVAALVRVRRGATRQNPSNQRRGEPAIVSDDARP